MLVAASVRAEAHASVLWEAIENTVATNQDLRELESRLDGRIDNLRTHTDGRFRQLYWMLDFNLALTLLTLSFTMGVLLKLLAG